ncbi:MAG: hypothetical protein IJK67_02200, partial [Bacilli bacterium]|nr:hypothetical protein [Bacilli bacterium]
MEKLTLEKFLIIKKKLSVVIEVLSKEYADRIETFNYEEIAKIINDRYITIQKELYDYDLSDIPFEAWKDVVIIGTKDHIADFSKTKANIDFNIVECDGYANFKGCNVRNIDNLYGYHYPEMFDKEVVESKNSYFISDLFDEEFKNKYYNNLLEVTDLVSLSSEQIDELKQKKWHYKLKVGFKYDYMWAIFPLEKCIQLYNTSLEEYETVGEIIDIFRYSSNRFFQKFVSEINNIDASQIKNMCFDFVRANIYSYDGNNRRLEDYPPLFKKENPNLYLEGVNIPDDVKKRYFERCLTIQDYLDYTDIFDNIVIDYFMNSSLAKTINENFGPGEFQKLVANHRDAFEYLNVNDNRFLTTSSYWQSVRENAELTFIDAVKNYYIQNKNLEGLEEKINEDGTKEYILPNWLSSLNFVVKGKISTKKDLLEYNEHVILEDRFQYRMLNTLNIDNIKKFDAETGFFTKIEERNSLRMLDAFEYFIMDTYNSPLTVNRGIDFKGGMLSYDEFKNMMAKTLDYMRRINIFTDYPDYEWMNGGSFSKEHPEIFIDKNAPSELRSAFYRRGITPKTLFHRWECIPYLLKTDLKNTIRLNMTLLSRGPAVPSLNLTYLPAEEDFILQYLKRYGKEKVLNLIARYGSILSGLVIKNFHDEIENEETIEKVIQEAIYNKIIEENADYMYLEQVPELVNRYPDIFVNFSSLKDYGYEVEKRLSLKRRFYEGKFTYDTIKQHPRLIPLLKDKNLYIAFRNQIGTKSGNRLIIGNNPYSYDTTYSDLELLTVYGNEKFLELCCKYGSYLDNITKHLYKNIDVRDNKYIDKKTGKEISYEEIDRRIEEIIIKEVRAGIMGYDPDYAPEFLKRKCPDLFLNDDAPEELKKCFYHMSSNYGMSFIILNKNKDWLNYLNGKAIITSLLRNGRYRSGLEIYFRLFGEEKGMKLGVSRAETVCKMLEDNKVELMKSWYDKTGGKFIPDYVIMQNISIEEADKFLASGTNWSALMKIKRFSWSPNGRDAMLKIAYAFGVFDNDKRGFKKTMELLTDIPRKIDADKGYIIGRIDDVIDKYSNRPNYFHVKVSRNLDGNSREMTPEEKERIYLLTLNTAQNSAFLDIFDHNVLINFLETIKNEKVDIDFAKPIFGQIYRKNDDGSYSLTINPQSYPKTTEIVRDILEKTRLLPVLNMDSAHRFLGGFKLEYDPEFREFFLKNYDTIMSDSKYLSQIAIIQRRFKEIKAVYS